jgi:hypothetical protein
VRGVRATLSRYRRRGKRAGDGVGWEIEALMCRRPRRHCLRRLLGWGMGACCWTGGRWGYTIIAIRIRGFSVTTLCLWYGMSLVLRLQLLACSRAPGARSRLDNIDCGGPVLLWGLNACLQLVPPVPIFKIIHVNVPLRGLDSSGR